MLVTLDVEQMLQNALQQEQELCRQLEQMQTNLLGLRGQIALLTSIKQQAEAQQAEAPAQPLEGGTPDGSE